MTEKTWAHCEAFRPQRDDVVEAVLPSGAIARRQIDYNSGGDIRYFVKTGDGIYRWRHCLPVVWRRWVRKHNAKVVERDGKPFVDTVYPVKVSPDRVPSTPANSPEGRSRPR